VDLEQRIGSLLDRARSGDRRAFDELVELHRPRLEALIESRLGKEIRRAVEPGDVLQETLLRAFSSIARFDPRGSGSFLRWLGGITEHVILNFARKAGHEAVLPLEQDLPGGGVSPSKALRRGERFDRLEDALARLSPEHRQVIVLARVEGLTTGEIAARMDRSEGAVRHLLIRALRSLRASFGDTESFHLPPRCFPPPPPRGGALGTAESANGDSRHEE